MQLNKIYRYHGIPKDELYTHLKTTLTEAFSGFDGISFETVLAADAASGFEGYKIYLNAEKSMWLRIHWDGDSNNPSNTIEMHFKNSQNKILTNCQSTNAYRYYNIVRTNYGVMFSVLGSDTTGAKMSISDTDFQAFFVAGNPNVFVYTQGGNSMNISSEEIWWSDLHSSAEKINCHTAINTSMETVSQTTLYNATSALEPIRCDHLYRLAIYSGKTGKMLIGDKYVILGCRYALEYNPNNDGVEYSPSTSTVDMGE